MGPIVGRPVIGTTAFVNNGRGATTTTLYGFDVARNTLVTIGGVPYSSAGIINPAINALGTPVQTVGAPGVTTVPTAASLAISRSGQALAILTPVATGTSGLYSVDLTAGAATALGGLPGGGVYTGLAFVLPTLQSYGQTANSATVGGILDQLVLSNDPRAQALIGSVDAQTSAAGQNAQLLALSPAAFSNLTEITLQSLHFQDTTVRRYLRDVRQGGTEAGAEAVAVGSDRHYAMWFTGNAHTGYLNGAADRYRTNYGDYGFTGGVDLRAARGTLLGLYGGYDTAQARLTPLSPQSDAKTWFAGGYGSATVGPVYIDAHGSYGETHYRTRRTVADGFGGGFQYTDDGGKPHSYQFGGAATAGISQDFRSVEVEPYVGAKYANVKLEAFSEGTAAGALSLPRLQTDSLESIAGLRLGLKIPVAGTRTVVRPSVRGEYRHAFESAGRGRYLAATFTDGAGGQFADPFIATALPKDYAAVGAGLTVSGASPFSIVIDYSGEVASQRAIHGLTGGFHLAF